MVEQWGRILDVSIALGISLAGFYFVFRFMQGLIKSKEEELIQWRNKYENLMRDQIESYASITAVMEKIVGMTDEIPEKTRNKISTDLEKTRETIIGAFEKSNK